MTEAVRIPAEEIRTHLLSGSGRLVCAYDSDEKFKAVNLEGAISLSEFQTELPYLSKNVEIVFYCA